jgi:hypothetical protein
MLVVNVIKLLFIATGGGTRQGRVPNKYIQASLIIEG